MDDRICNMVLRLEQTVKESHEVCGLILMGSFGAGQADKGSDLDLFCLFREGALLADSVAIFEAELLVQMEPSNILKVLRPENKLIFYLKEPYLKIDLEIGCSLEGNARYLRGSEECRVLVDKTASGDLVEQLALLMTTRAVDALPDYSADYHVTRFLEMFELLCKNVARGDIYRAQFYAFILRHSLVVLERIAQGHTVHLYLPKQAFERADCRAKQLRHFDEAESSSSLLNDYADFFVSLQRTLGRQSDRPFLAKVIEHYRARPPPV